MVRRSLLLCTVVNLGHRGTGPTRPGHPFPENSLSSFRAAIDVGAHGVEVDAVLTKDGKVVIIHDETLDRTTNHTGRVGSMTLAEVQASRLLDGHGHVTTEHPPTLEDVYFAVDGDSLINIELKAYPSVCASFETPPDLLVDQVLREVMRLGGQSRTIFSSFDASVARLVKTRQPGFYSALLSETAGEALVERAVELEQDAIHPDTTVTAQTVQAALASDLQVNVWNAKTAEEMRAQIDKGVTAMISDEPAILTNVMSMTR